MREDPILLAVYSSSFECPTKTLAAFFTQFFGGPREYEPRRWSLSLREAHQRFSIGERERVAWLRAMERALADVRIEESTRGALHWFFAQSSAFLINQPAGAPDAPIPSLEPPNEGPQLREIRQRWQELRALEEMIAALRLGRVGAVLESLQSPLIEACFSRDRAAFLSFLALLQSSGQPALLDYARLELLRSPGLVAQTYGAGRTLLHDVAGQGSPGAVELLIQLGADPNARDDLERTPCIMSAMRCMHPLAPMLYAPSFTEELISMPRKSSGVAARCTWLRAAETCRWRRRC
ncbi:hypothetical protein KDH_74030 [Dictyobacter sp. S3.2.2.5]|uniref:Ankyrin repeat domain-containing protein n=1 Tax=Dictyobacter halimunensis TaxID=3026934 RepID=A0ABQ6G229_9CHLR|nr:hypothetical protein KDH_74030 [Dictyobacter sp. S3.2.2.5]